jgi:hypothetical protein
MIIRRPSAARHPDFGVNLPHQRTVASMMIRPRAWAASQTAGGVPCERKQHRRRLIDLVEILDDLHAHFRQFADHLLIMHNVTQHQDAPVLMSGFLGLFDCRLHSGAKSGGG